jgi:O-acetyl-ADP-ribose deacetylase (regulator of RNase III)
MIIVKKGDITEEECDAIVNPANSLGYMGGGVALAIKLKGGKEIEEEAVRKAPIPLGKAIATKAGKLKCKFVIHSPTMQKPAEKIPLENVRLATRAALELAKELKIKSIAFPGMGTGVGGIKAEDAARVMIEECKKFEDLEIRLVAFDEKLYQAFKKFESGKR